MGDFYPIYPNANYSYYKQFFEEERPLNNLLEQQIPVKNLTAKMVQKRKAGDYVFMHGSDLRGVYDRYGKGSARAMSGPEPPRQGNWSSS